MKKLIIVAAILLALCGCSEGGIAQDITVGSVRYVTITEPSYRKDLIYVDKIQSEGWTLVQSRDSKYWFVRKQQ